MSEKSKPIQSFDTHEPDTLLSFQDFILAHPVIVAADPAITELDFDLDETLFRYQRGAPEGQYIGSWRPETPQLLSALRQAGFAQINVLSSKSIEEIGLAMDVYGQQFGAEQVTPTFDKLLSTRDYDTFGNKYQALPEVARQASGQARRVVFIDDARLDFGNEAPFGFINVPPEMQYLGQNAELFTVSTVK